MSKPRGRPRKHKEREKSGRGSRAAAEKEIKEFARWQRRHLNGIVPTDLILDQKAETPLGVLYLSARISEEQFHAGEEYAQAVRFYRVVSGMPLDLPSRMGIRGADNREFPSEVVDRAKTKYAMLRRKLIRAGKGVLSAVSTLVIDERTQRDEDKIKLVLKGLVALVGLLPGITPRRTKRA